MPPVFADESGRRWLVTDLSDAGEFGRCLQLGSPRACYREFRGEARRRLYPFRPGEDRGQLTRAAIREQLSMSYDPDAPCITRDKVAVIQELYASRRGMGRR
jgi:hypothetical protein